MASPSEIQPFQHLCSILKSIAASATAEDVAEAPSEKHEAAAKLFLGLSKLMSDSEPPKTECRAKQASKHSPDEEDMSRYFDKDYSCFFCRKKCYSKDRFFLHFKTHFKSASNRLKRGLASDGSDAEPDTEEETGPKRRRGATYLSRKRTGKGGKASNDDADSGCHSVGESSEDVESDCFLGDSESSDSDTGSESRRLRLAARAHKRPKSRKSSSAGISLKDRLSLAEKQLDNNETEDLICLTCLKRFSNCQNLRRHLRLHIARDSITPDVDRDEDPASGDCDEAGGGRFLCDWCPLRFDNRAAARVHEATHKGQDPVCYVCDKRYADRYTLRYHLRTHGIGRQIRCEYCNKSFSKPSRLEAHVRAQHNNIRDFSCGECGRAFKTRVHLKTHLLQHTGERPFACTVCNDKFRHKASLQAHMRSHEGVRPFCCETCGKTFREPSTLKAHSRVHTGDKPYKCNLCNKAFTQRAGLNNHRKSHLRKAAAASEGLGLFHCHMCDFSHSEEASMDEHYKLMHHAVKSVKSPATAPLPSPPLQSGDALYADVAAPSNAQPLPSFDNLRNSPSTSPAYESSYHDASPPLTPAQEDLLPGIEEASGFLSPITISEISSQFQNQCYSEDPSSHLQSQTQTPTAAAAAAAGYGYSGVHLSAPQQQQQQQQYRQVYNQHHQYPSQANLFSQQSQATPQPQQAQQPEAQQQAQQQQQHCHSMASCYSATPQASQQPAPQPGQPQQAAASQQSTATTFESSGGANSAVTSSSSGSNCYFYPPHSQHPQLGHPHLSHPSEGLGHSHCQQLSASSSSTGYPDHLAPSAAAYGMQQQPSAVTSSGYCI